MLVATGLAAIVVGMYLLAGPGWPTTGSDGPGESELRLARLVFVAPWMISAAVLLLAALVSRADAQARTNAHPCP